MAESSTMGGGARERRDRDGAGRPRNARPRDGLGRPLPRGATGVPTTPEDVVLSPSAALTQAQRLIEAGQPFHAHEVLEGVWKSAPDNERELWRGLAQLAVGLTHGARGNPTGASRLLLRAAERVARYADRAPHGIPAADLASWATELARHIERHGLEQIPASALTPRLHS
ncbi:DUF309 domain-containing protein [Phytohabitans sp. ZYX-F-186]|uniref:DUF309 domain-containing protein n=1 Tax=Phytohabitans maris TaxID=3071409 RepID=A0ABU0ZWD8_9ACTN|nr:DUF309 domain-containing protein [Phytohabitans sp. ZYX-F-186]MDQ7911355.1 DUF309 domain-containing protein [Phytohabitans sp. ZYX-F-186]